METKKVETRKDEIRIVTRDLAEMRGKFLAERLMRKWKEDFVDEDTGQIVSIERGEIIMDRGVLLNADNLSMINFHLQAGDIKEVSVSNQRRVGFMAENNYQTPWLAAIQMDKKKKKFILYASSLEQVIEIVKDYAELNFSQPFVFTMAKEFDSCILLKDTLKKYQVDNTLDMDNITSVEDDDDSVEGKFYQIDVMIKPDDFAYPQTFVIETSDVDKAMAVIRDYLTKETVKNGFSAEKLEIKLEGAKVIPCDVVIDKEFSLAYAKADDYTNKKAELAKQVADFVQDVKDYGITIKSAEQIELERQVEDILGRPLKDNESINLKEKIISGEFAIHGYSLTIDGEDKLHWDLV